MHVLLPLKRKIWSLTKIIKHFKIYCTAPLWGELAYHVKGPLPTLTTWVQSPWLLGKENWPWSYPVTSACTPLHMCAFARMCGHTHTDAKIKDRTYQEIKQSRGYRKWHKVSGSATLYSLKYYWAHGNTDTSSYITTSPPAPVFYSWI